MVIKTFHFIASRIFWKLIQNTIVSNLFLSMDTWVYGLFYLLVKMVGLKIRQFKQYFPNDFSLNN